MKCRGKRETTWTILRSITFIPLHFMFYRGKTITFGTVYPAIVSVWKLFLAAVLLKWQSQEIFWHFFFVNRTPVGYSSFAEKLFSRRYSNFKFKFFYSIVVLYSVILRGVAMFWHIVHIYLKKLIFSFKARRGLQRKAGKTPHSVSLDWVRLCTVLVTFGFLENLISWLHAVLACAESDSAQC